MDEKEKEKQRLQKILTKLIGNNSHEWLAKEIGTSTFTVRSWIVGNSFPNKDSLVLLADYMDIGVGDLIAKLQGVEKDKDTFPTTAEQAFFLINNLGKDELIKLLKYIVDELQ